MNTPENYKDEEDIPLRIGAGSFATVFVWRGNPVAFKVVHSANDTPALEVEFHSLTSLYSLWNTDSFFRIPKPLGFLDPSCNESSSLFKPLIDTVGNTNAIYAMKRVYALPGHVGAFLRDKYFPRGFSRTPNVARLYFGKSFDEDARAASVLPRFFNSNNFPLDASRYELLYGQMPFVMPATTKVAWEMGDMLGRIQFRAGYDARDIEFILGGNGLNGIEFYVIDFNQMRSWNRTADEVPVLVAAFFQNDPYYPRPCEGSALYSTFKLGYRASVAAMPGAAPLAELFLSSIQKKQAERDRAVQAGRTV